MTSFINDDNDQINYGTDDLVITKQVASFRNFKIKGDVSISFNVPNTSTNRKALGYYGFQQINNPTFSKNVFNLVKDGNILMRGYLVIEEDNGKELSLYFISGNANWFRAFDFSCKEIRNNGYQVRWTGTTIVASVANTTGIVFPFIDYMFQRQKHDRYSFCMNISGVDNDDVLNINNFPCLYMSTLVQELAKVANIRINGNLLNDKLYKSLIVTPEGPEIYNENGLISSEYADAGVSAAGLNDIIHIEDIAPSMKAIEIIKYLCFKFGCVPVFDEFSQTLTLNILDKYLREDASDWSEYIVDYKISFDQYKNYFVRVKEAEEEEIQFFNSQYPDTLFAELQMESGKEDGPDIDLYTDPFAPVKDDVGTTALNWATPFVQFYELEDGDAIPYTSVTNQSGKATFQAEINLDISNPLGFLWRVEDDNGIYTGYHVNFLNLLDYYAQSNADYISDSTGFLYPQRITKVKGGPRVLVCIPNFAVSNFTQESSLNIYGIGDVSNVSYAYFHKPNYADYPVLNSYRPGLWWGGELVLKTDFNATDTTPIPPVPPIQYIVTFAVAAELSVPSAAKFYYKINAGAWTLMRTTTVPVWSAYTVLSSDALTVDDGDTVQIGVLNASDVNVTFGVTDVSSATYTGYCGQDATTEFTVSSNITKYINLKCTAGSPNEFTTC
jgi:hypothetical protein